MFKRLSIISAFIFGLAGSVSAQTPSGEANYAPGAVLDFYVLSAATKPAQHGGPARRSNATLLDDTPPVFEFSAPMEIEPSLEEFRDRDWGIRWRGFLKLEESGDHSFSFRFDATSMSKCAAYLKFNNQDLININHSHRNRGFSNYYAADLNLKSGLYPYEIWMACDASYGRDFKITWMDRGPRDSLPRALPTSAFYYRTR